MNGFESLGLSEEILSAINDLGFENPTPIQQQAIPLLLSERTDLVGLAQTGTGKTCAFGLPLLSAIDLQGKRTQGLVICPTRELALQITNDLRNFSKYLRGLKVVPIYGGVSIDNQARDIRKGAHVIVATPGRLMDMINRRIVDINAVHTVVLDEADEMLNMGFKEDIDAILQNVPDDRSTWLFSATMPAEVARISKNYMSNPKEITVGKQNAGADKIEHIYYMVREKDRYFALKRIIDFHPDIYGIIFCRTRNETRDVAEKLIKDGYNCEALHGDLSQAQRDHVMKKYRERTVKLLCATDVAARGIDVKEITHVINYNLPDDVENYTHRSGRTARAGKSGLSIALINTREMGKISMIERQIKKDFTRGLIPSGEQICEKQLFNLIEKMASVKVDEEEIAKYLPRIEEMFKDLSKEEIIKRFVSAEFNHFLNYYRNSEDLNVSADRRRESKGRDGYSCDDRRTSKGVEEGMQRMFINVGEMDEVNKGMLVRLICDHSGIQGKDIGRIDVKREFSFFDVTEQYAQKVKQTISGMEMDNGRLVRVELASGGGSRGGGDRGDSHRGGKDRSRSGKFGKSQGRSSSSGSKYKRSDKKYSKDSSKKKTNPIW